MWYRAELLIPRPLVTLGFQTVDGADINGLAALGREDGKRVVCRPSCVDGIRAWLRVPSTESKAVEFIRHRDARSLELAFQDNG